VYKKLIDLNCLNTKSKYPIYAFLSISNICNANCIFCDVHENKCIKTSVNVYSILDQMKEIGIKFIHLEVRSNNYSAISLYEKIGFKISGERKNYYNNCDAKLYVYEV